MKSKKSTQTQTSTRILGIDPGYGRMGIAVIEKQNGKELLLYSECFETNDTLSHGERLALLSQKLENIFSTWNIDILGIETLLFSKNVKTALKVAEARGVIISEATKRKVSVHEFNPNSIKLAVTGYGKADKKQIIQMIEMIFHVQKEKKENKIHDDEYDAIAVALTASVNLSTRII